MEIDNPLIDNEPSHIFDKDPNLIVNICFRTVYYLNNNRVMQYLGYMIHHLIIVVVNKLEIYYGKK